jgi:DNA-binding GntR family transcriptional regulator
MTTTILTKPRLHSFAEDFLFTPTEDDTKAGFYYFERLRAVEDETVFFEKIILPNRYLPGFSRQRLENRSLFDLLRTKYGLLVKGGEQKVLAVTADGDLARQLGVVVSTPVLRLDKRLDTNRPDFSFYSSLYAKTDSYILHGRF